jgi:hypothetical protein
MYPQDGRALRVVVINNASSIKLLEPPQKIPGSGLPRSRRERAVNGPDKFLNITSGAR